jgi:hypothetical protein
VLKRPCESSPARGGGGGRLAAGAAEHVGEKDVVRVWRVVVQTGVVERGEDRVGKAKCLRSGGAGAQQLVGQAPMVQGVAADLVAELGQPCPSAAVQVGADAGPRGARSAV